MSEKNSGEMPTMTYADAGVDNAAGNETVELMKEAVHRTHGRSVLAGLGTFGGMYKIPGSDQVLVTSIDGVGTRIEVAIAADRHETSGQALVAHCINDIACQGAKPAYFVDYIAGKEYMPEWFSRVVIGAAEECKKHGVALIGGETAAMPGFYTPGVYDFVGCITGFVRHFNNIIDGSEIRPGDACVGLSSLGLHTNGYSLARKIIFDTLGLTINDMLPWGISVADELLKPHLCYWPWLESYINYFTWHVHGLAHITGGGIPGNLVRILPEDCHAVIKQGEWDVPPIFPFLQEQGNVPTNDMFRTFNMGIGYIVVLPSYQAPDLVDLLNEEGLSAQIIGQIHSGPRGVTVE